MNKFLNKCLTFFALVLAACSMPLAASAQAGQPLTPLPPLHSDTSPAAPARPAVPAPAAGASAALYNGQDLDNAGLTLAPWGGGSVEDDAQVALDGSNSLRVTTVDLYQGGRINFSTPVPLGDLSDKTRYLEMKMRFPKAVVEAPQQGGFGGFGGGRRGRRGGFGGGPGGFGGPGGGDDTTDQTPYNPDAPPVITTLRWVFTLADGRQAEILRPLPDKAVMGDGWFTLAVPLSVLKFAGGAASGQNTLQSITIAGDGYGVFNIGEIAIVSDSAPIDALAGQPQDVYADAPVTLQASGSGGLSMLLYAWDFDTHGPFVDEAEGQTVTAQYPSGGKDYTVTLVVSDVDGIKPSVTSATTVHVH